MNRTGSFIFTMKGSHLLYLLIAGLIGLRFLAWACAPINQDEGWYLLGARNTANGLNPYGDFAFTQGPVFLWVYGVTQPAWQTLTGARLFTGILGILTVFPAAYLASRLSASRLRIESWSLVIVLLGWNLFQAENSTIVKTYALAGLFFTGGLALLVKSAFDMGRKALFVAGAAGAMIAVAAGVRISLGAALPLIFVYLFIRRRSLGAHLCWGFAIGSGILLLVQFGWAWSCGGAAWIDNQFGYHLARDGFQWSKKLVGIGGHLSRLASHYALAAFICCLCLLLRSSNRPEREAPSRGLTGLMVAALSGPFLVHLGAPFPYDDYQAPLYPAACALLSAHFISLWPSAKLLRAGILGAAVAAALLTAGSPVIQKWFVLRKNTIAWEVREKPALLSFREDCKEIKRIIGDDPVWTMDATVPAETGNSLPLELTMGVFSFFPEASDTDIQRLNGLGGKEPFANRPVDEKTNWILTSEWTFAVASPGATRYPEEKRLRLINHLTTDFEAVATWQNFGQDAGDLTLWKRKFSVNTGDRSE